MHGAMRLRKKGKINPRYIGPYRISKGVGNIEYEFDLPLELQSVHPMFHISMQKSSWVIIHLLSLLKVLE